ncbi:MAG TPA: IS110 family transposase [Candidatus Atribacteria bacterium]|nr:IS110 family transposase [Candidatus Atribacteria bacterium]
MKINKTTNNLQLMDLYDYYIAIDWSIDGASIARMRSNSMKVIINNIASNVKSIKEYLKALKGKKILTIEETTGAQWLYVELKDSVDKLIICNPSRNRLLEEGSKTDKIDAGKLCQLLRAGMLKEVYHTDNENSYRIRKLVSAYDDLTSARVRVKNQYSAIYRSIGLKKTEKGQYDKKDKAMNFILEHQIAVMKTLDEEREKFEALFRETVRNNHIIKQIKQISGFGDIQSVRAYGIIIDASRFKNKYRLWCYSGLAKNKRESGKKSFNKRDKRYSRKLKCVFKMATHAALGGKNDIREYYEYLLTEGYTEKDARNTITRYLATSVYAVMKNKTKYEPYHWRKKLEIKAA